MDLQECRSLTLILGGEVMTATLQTQFELLLPPTEEVDDNMLTRLILLILIHFKHFYLSKRHFNYYQQFLCPIQTDLVELGFSFLLVAIENTISEDELKRLQYYFDTKSVDTSLLSIYQSMGQNYTLENFLDQIEKCQDTINTLKQTSYLINNFQEFIMKFKVFNDIFCTEQRNENKKISPSISPSHFVYSDRLSIDTSSKLVPKKGLCVIINIMGFNGHPERLGSQNDVKLIENIFHAMNFTTLLCIKDFSKNDLDVSLNDLKYNKDKYDKYDCLALFLMTHGEINCIVTHDAQLVYLKEAITNFNDSGSSIWKKKIRCFFINSCRLNTSKQVNIVPYSKHAIHDEHLSFNMCIAYSCNAFEKSFRSETAGSIYIKMLCTMLYNYSHIYSVKKILNITDKLFDERIDTDHYFHQNPKHLQYLSDHLYFSNQNLTTEIPRLKTFDHSLLCQSPWIHVNDYVKEKIECAEYKKAFFNDFQ
ncbi:unnamed protein product [Didymodactylos carnosus]|uniref:Caspase-8 n=1 Tax=Didymodactylos carnosus TaxID=1234261 RepID=A0A815KQ76_9BILA|nr:unnamed protein product [Didymodactylos carnosus]CAF1399290.1 unnamed protein product [Didymodactylos carnosus]CAF3772353.1 unnamed protein product [Didymodactylos carnosus]CAF4293328.1 unnamed protein product [Didymodactylos carnosus]